MPNGSIAGAHVSLIAVPCGTAGRRPPASADRVTGRPGESQDRADHDDNAGRPGNGDLGGEAGIEESDAENNYRGLLGRVGRGIGGMPVDRWYRRDGLRRGGSVPEQVPLAALAVAGICAGTAVAGRAVA
jgi:hypothetical protein